MAGKKQKIFFLILCILIFSVVTFGSYEEELKEAYIIIEQLLNALEQLEAENIELKEQVEEMEIELKEAYLILQDIVDINVAYYEWGIGAGWQEGLMITGFLKYSRIGIYLQTIKFESIGAGLIYWW